MDVTFFTDIGNQIEMAIGLVLADIQKGFISGLLSVAKLGLVLYIIVYGYMILAGKKQTPIQDLLWDLSRMAIILAFMQGADGLLILVNESVDGLKGFFVNGENGFSLLDNKFSALADLATHIWVSADGIAETLLAILKILALLPLLFGFIACGSLIIYSEIILKILLATAPIFIFCLMWGFLKDSFARWLSAIFGNCLVLLFVSVTMQLSFKLASMATTSGELRIWVSIIMYILSGMLSLSAIKWGREIALNLASVAVDRATGGVSNSITRDIAKNLWRRFKKKQE